MTIYFFEAAALAAALAVALAGALAFAGAVAGAGVLAFAGAAAGAGVLAFAGAAEAAEGLAWPFTVMPFFDRVSVLFAPKPLTRFSKSAQSFIIRTRQGFAGYLLLNKTVIIFCLQAEILASKGFR